MSTVVLADDAERFRAIVARRLGLQFEDGKLDFLAEVLGRRIEALHRDSRTYLAGLDDAPTSEELAMLARELTVGETYFFRNNDQFRAFAEVCLPERLRARTDQRCLRLLSAGCASGEEAYTLAILAKEQVPAAWEVSILGIDVNPAVIDKALRAHYSAWALRETSHEAQQRWFRFEGRDAVLDDAIRTAVHFEQRNLAVDDPRLWPPETYDVIFCRNVIMYFTPECAQAVIARLARALVPGGYLFLGHAETLRGLSCDFHLRHTHGTFYYQRKDPRENPRARQLDDAPRATTAAAPLMLAVEGSDCWVEAIRRASERIETITASQRRTPSASPTPSVSGRRSDLGGILDLLRQERFADALGLIQALPSETAQDPDVLLLRAVLLTHNGQPDEAERSCRELLGIDDLNAGAHYVLALCREAAGDHQGAITHDQLATYLDRAFAMPRLHLGLIARKQGDHATACLELAQALTLLQREDPSRLLLFGGGFGREALMGLCQAELLSCGGGL